MATNTAQASTPAVSPDPSAPNPSGGEQPDESVLADDVLETVKEIALDEVPGGTLVRVEADADGVGYLAHMLNADETPMTVYVDPSLDLVDLA
ncbi:MAG TPA: hypothetical protein VH210_12215 [Gaiellaceae bacterium]|nr:hypothetical protein [Gaiellaceae bacterium]